MSDDVITDNQLNALAQGIMWRLPNEKGGLTKEDHHKIQDGKERHDYPEPSGDIREWAMELDIGQVVTAYYDYHEKWTWDSGLPEDEDILKVLKKEMDLRGGPPEVGDAYFNTENNNSYIYVDGEWVIMSSIGMVDE